MKTFIVDSFTNRPFAGNPAGVCHVEGSLPDETMLQIAKELGLSETSFVRATDSPTVFEIRYFSPKMEIPLCGHGTLAAAKVWFDAAESAGADRVTFITARGVELVVERRGKKIAMVLPAYEVEPRAVPPAVLVALGIERPMESVFNRETQAMLVVVEDAEEIARLKPDSRALAETDVTGWDGIAVAAAAKREEHDIHVRYFWPWSGTDEDPVTGAIQTFIAPYFAKRLGRETLRVFQASARTGEMEVEVGTESVTIVGEAVIVFHGGMHGGMLEHKLERSGKVSPLES